MTFARKTKTPAIKSSKRAACLLAFLFLNSGWNASAADKISAPAKSSQGASQAFLNAVNEYYAALEAKDLDHLSRIVDSDLIMLEGTYKNVGWADFRDHHIGPEMKEWKSFKARDRKLIAAEARGSMGYAIEELTYDMDLPKERVVLSAVETFILVKSSSGTWKIRHVHSSAKKRAP